MKVLILATCRNPDLIDGTTLVFRTIRTGFPTAEIIVFDNGNSELHRSEIREACKKAKTKFVHLPERVYHAEWIEGLVTAAMEDKDAEPFFICDTDVVFWKSVEDWSFGDVALAGRLIPDFFDEFTKCVTINRPHTSLMYFNPKQIKNELDAYRAQFPQTILNPLVNMFQPFFHRYTEPEMLSVKNVFYDTCSMLCKHVRWSSFSVEHLDCYDHLNCGTSADLVEPHGHAGLVERQKAIYADISKAKGLWQKQQEYYAHFKV